MSSTVTVDTEVFRRLQADARRYEFLKNQARSGSLHMDGTARYMLSVNAIIERGRSFDEAVDKSMRIREDQKKELLVKYPNWPNLKDD